MDRTTWAIEVHSSETLTNRRFRRDLGGSSVPCNRQASVGSFSVTIRPILFLRECLVLCALHDCGTGHILSEDYLRILRRRATPRRVVSPKSQISPFIDRCTSKSRCLYTFFNQRRSYDHRVSTIVTPVIMKPCAAKYPLGFQDLAHGFGLFHAND